MLLVNGRLLVAKFWEVRSYAWLFDCMGVGAPNPCDLQRLTV